MGFGNLDRQIVISSVAETVSGNGERSESWSAFHNCWAAIEYGIKGQEGEDYEAGQLVSSNTVKFLIRYYPGITTKMKITYSSVDYNILHISEQGRERFLILKAEKK